MPMFRRAAILTVIALIGLPVPSSAADGSGDIEFLSKRDTKSVFAMTHAQWISYVHGAVQAGAAKAMGSATSGLAMGMKTAGGSLVVRPDYRNGDARPAFIQVTVAYRYPKSATLSEEALTGAIEAVRQRMAPEYEVIGKIQRFRAGVALVYIVAEAPPR